MVTEATTDVTTPVDRVGVWITVVGAGGAGAGGGGGGATGRVSVGTVIVGTVTVGPGNGTGPMSATAVPAHAPSPASAAKIAADLITPSTPPVRFRLRPRPNRVKLGWAENVTAVKTDYYELLGIRRDADGETIRRAFHAAARDCHPDVSSSPGAEQRFRELAEAYSVLSKPGPRLLYDRYGYRGRGNSGFDEALWEARERAPRGGSVHGELVLRSAEAAAGGMRVIRFESARPCPACEGRGSARRPDCPDCGGTGRRSQVSHREAGRFLQIDVCPTCNGEVCPECEGVGHRRVQRRLRVRIPAELEDGEQLRVGGEGDALSLDGIPGDLLLDVRVLPKPHDSRLIRYLALALFLTALALLIAYLV